MRASVKGHRLDKPTMTIHMRDFVRCGATFLVAKACKRTSHWAKNRQIRRFFCFGYVQARTHTTGKNLHDATVVLLRAYTAKKIRHIVRYTLPAPPKPPETVGGEIHRICIEELNLWPLELLSATHPQNLRGLQGAGLEGLHLPFTKGRPQGE